MSTEPNLPSGGSAKEEQKPERFRDKLKRWAHAFGKFLVRIWRGVVQIMHPIVNFFVEIFRTIIYTLRAFLYVIVKTPYVLFPSSAHSSLEDEKYSKDKLERYKTVVDGLKELNEANREFIKENWLDQIDWTNKRATKERDANELIRWWQIILGVVIPVLVQSNETNTRNAAGIAGISVAILTAVYQFRRPEERWRHYRTVNERYQIELGNFISRSLPEYLGKAYNDIFPVFNQRMTAIRQEELSQFFSVVAPTPESKKDEDKTGG